MDLIDIYRPSIQKSQNTCSSACGTFFGTDHMLGHKSVLSTFKKTEIILSIFSDHNAMKLEIATRKLQKKTQNKVKAKQYTSKTTNGSLKKSKRKFKKYL